jgi:hypothetical protein
MIFEWKTVHKSLLTPITSNRTAQAMLLIEPSRPLHLRVSRHDLDSKNVLSVFFFGIDLVGGNFLKNGLFKVQPLFTDISDDDWRKIGGADKQ